eukprot:c20883_g2_i2.p1 GENE.c20883_g2_i2~~c20883_g2_i2.p1  ORF type:complete len:264 (+),score=85.90 c20883_g2_i2:51-842(+)
MSSEVVSNTICCVFCGKLIESSIIEQHETNCLTEWKNKREILPIELRPSTPTRPQRDSNLNDSEYNQMILSFHQDINSIECLKCHKKINGFEKYSEHIKSDCNETKHKNRFYIISKGLIAAERMRLARQAIICIYCGQAISPSLLVSHEPLCLQNFRLGRITLPQELRLDTPRLPPRADDLTKFSEAERLEYNSKVSRIYKDMTEIGCPYCDRNFDGYFKMVKHMNDCKNLKMLGIEATKNKHIFSAVETPKKRHESSFTKPV